MGRFRRILSLFVLIFWPNLSVVFAAPTAITNTSLGAEAQIDCPENYRGVNQKRLLGASLVGTKWFGMAGGNHIRRGMGDPLFKAIFKSFNHYRYINDVFHDAYTWPVLLGIPFQIKCVNSLADVRSLNPNIWEICQTGVTVQFYVHSIENITVIICPAFYDLPEEYDLQAKPDTCPEVRYNRFVENRRRITFPPSRAITMFGAALWVYGATKNDDAIGGVPGSNVWLDWDKIIGHNSSYASECSSSYVLLAELAKNDCSTVPDVTLPPWNVHGIGVTEGGNNAGNPNAGNVSVDF